MVVFNDELWVSGAFDSVDHVSLSNVAIWNGEHWCSPGPEKFPHHVLTMAPFGDTLYLGGPFWHIDGDSSKAYLVKYNPAAPRTCGPKVETSIIELEPLSRLEVFPNPNYGRVTVSCEDCRLPLQVRVFDLTGKVVSEVHGMRQGRFDLDIPGPSGMYFMEVLDGEQNRRSMKLNKM